MKKDKINLLQEISQILKECKDFYSLVKAFGKYRAEKYSFEDRMYEAVDKLGEAHRAFESIVAENFEPAKQADAPSEEIDPEAEGQPEAESKPEAEGFVYKPNEKDEIDVKFAEFYNGYKKNKAPVRKIKKHAPGEEMVDEDPETVPSGAFRYYDLGGCGIIFEAYDMRYFYFMYRPKGFDMRNEERFFGLMQKELVMAEFRKVDESLLAKSNTMIIKEKMNLKKDAELLKVVLKELGDQIKEAQEKKLEQIRFGTILNANAVDNLERMYPIYQNILPPLEELQVLCVDSVPEFTNPNQWALSECMENLLFKQRLNPNIHDNYGESLLNYAIRTHKQ